MPDELPFVTVIMPIRNEGTFVARSLGSVLAQNYPSDRMEVIVADGESTDDTREIVRALQTQHPNLLLIDNPGKIVSTGMNAALRHAQGEIIVRVDGHTEIAPDYVSQCAAELQRTGADNVGGRMIAVGEERFGKAVALAMNSRFGTGGARFHYSDREEWVDTVYMGTWQRNIFDQLGLFDEELVRDQDDEFNYRLREHGGRILLSPKIKSQYTTRSNFISLWRQYFQYGYWKVRVMQKHPRQMRLRQFVPPVFASAFFGPFLLTWLTPYSWVLLLLVASCYGVANLVASFGAAHQNGWQYLPILPLVYSNLHLSYGLGFLVGLVKFWNRWGDKRTYVATQKSVSKSVLVET